MGAIVGLVGTADFPSPVRRARTVLTTVALAGLLVTTTAVASPGEVSAAPAPVGAAPAMAAPIEVAYRPVGPAASAAANVVTYANAARRARGLAPLRASAALNRAALNQAGYMARAGRMTHTGSGGTTVGTRVPQAGYRWSMVGENVAFGQRNSARVVAAWMASPPHAANILNSRYTQIGVGVVSRHGVLWWCMVLARPR